MHCRFAQIDLIADYCIVYIGFSLNATVVNFTFASSGFCYDCIRQKEEETENGIMATNQVVIRTVQMIIVSFESRFTLCISVAASAFHILFFIY